MLVYILIMNNNKINKKYKNNKIKQYEDVVVLLWVKKSKKKNIKHMPHITCNSRGIKEGEGLQKKTNKRKRRHVGRHATWCCGIKTDMQKSFFCVCSNNHAMTTNKQQVVDFTQIFLKYLFFLLHICCVTSCLNFIFFLLIFFL